MTINNITIAKAVDEGYYVKEGFKVVSVEFLEDGIYDALEGYSVHPEHVAVADSKVRPYTKIRSCLDFEV